MHSLSICVINHNTPELTQNCVRSIFENTQDIAVEVIVVNNTPQPCDLSNFDVQYIQNEQPRGFGANQNLMLRRAKGHYLVSLNSDTLVHPNAFHNLIRFMNAHPKVGIAGPRLQYANGKLQPSMRNFPTGLTCFVETSGVIHVLKKFYFPRSYKLCDPHTQNQFTDWLTGACLIIRKEAMLEVGAYDEQRYPMYAEDLDWCWRMTQAGWQIAFVADATLTHFENQSPMSNRAKATYEGTFTFCKAHYSPAKQRAVKRGFWGGLALRRVLARTHESRTYYHQLLNCVEKQRITI